MLSLTKMDRIEWNQNQNPKTCFMRKSHFMVIRFMAYEAYHHGNISVQ